MNHDLWVRLAVTFGSFGLWLACIVGYDVYQELVYGHLKTISHAMETLGRTYQIAAPMLTAFMIGIPAGLIVHFWGP